MLKKSFLVVFIVLFIDQALKLWIKTNMTLGQEFHVAGNWFIIHFTENNGMAFGLQFAGGYGKLALSLFRIFAVGFLGWYIFRLAKSKTAFGVIFCFSLILAGAMGNIIDSALYGMVFSESTYFDVARFLPAEGGYSTFLHGKVVDMFYFPILEGNYPQWLPFLGGDHFIFFRPVFNVADSAITTGVLSLLIFQRQFFNTPKEKPEDHKDEIHEVVSSEPADNISADDE
ncbi:MAG: lipoprotein signal peptidase [Bacteroidales bacterium]|nr:lipoprotein signal peptidase [Bacteroidales bacterium]